MAGRLLFGWVDCAHCGFKADGRNAMGLAQQHANRTGHDTEVSLTYVMSPDPRKQPRSSELVRRPRAR